MTPQGDLREEVGVRELNSRLSRYVQHVADGAEVTITMRGKPVARIVPVGEQDPFADLRARGLLSEPASTRRWLPRRIAARGSVSDLVAEQRR